MQTIADRKTAVNSQPTQFIRAIKWQNSKSNEPSTEVLYFDIVMSHS